MIIRLTELFQKLQDHEIIRFAASLSFYTALSFAPLLIFFVIVSSGLDPGLQSELQRHVAQIAGPEAGGLVQTVIQNSQSRPDLTSLAGLIGIATLLFSASLIFGELRSAMDRIFDCRNSEEYRMGYWRSVINFLKARLLHVGMVMSFTLMIVVSLVSSSLVYGTLLFENRNLASLTNLFTSLGFYILAFAVIIRYLPSNRQDWRMAFKAGTVISVMFLIGKELISYYLSRAAVGSAYGAVGSIVALLVWVYYSSIIVLVGAEASRVLLPSRRALDNTQAADN